MKIVLVVILCLGFISPNAFGADNTKKIISELSTDLDIAESSLRIILNKPSKGEFPSGVSCGDKLNASMNLLNFEMRHPGYLQGKFGTSTWGQYNGVRDLFDQLSGKYNFFFPRSTEPVIQKNVNAVK